MGKKRGLREFKAALARAGSPLLWPAEVVKYSDDQPRDDHGRWTASDGGGVELDATGQPRQGAAAIRARNEFNAHVGLAPVPANRATILHAEQTNIHEWMRQHGYARDAKGNYHAAKAGR